MRHLRCWATIVFSVFLLTTPAAAEIITLGASRDNTLIQVPTAGSPQFSNGSGPTLFVGRNNGADGTFRRRGLVFFDIAGLIPEGSVITSVSLTMQVTNPGIGADVVQLRRLFSDWGEGGSFATGGQGAPAQPPDATWFYNRFNTSFWSTPGGDFAGAASASTLVSGLGLQTWATTSLLVADVQSWLDAPATNFGWLLLGEESEARNVHGFATREAAGATGPRLTIEYTAAIPEPGSLALAAVGFVCAVGFSRCWRRVSQAS